MSSNDPIKVTSSPNAKAKLKEKDREKKAKATANKQQTERLKTVVRRLPPNLPEDIFWQSVEQWVSEETVIWKVYYQGKFRKRLNKENIPSRAYIAFKNEELVAIFSREYDGHLFRDKAGNESIAIVEFAPFQKIPSEKKKVDSRMGTIDKDEDYLSFLESLKDGGSKPGDVETLETLIAASQPPPQPTTTPLLEALKAEKSAQRDKEAILRNHAHYKDQSTTSGSKKDDAKKKGTAATSTQKPPEQQLSKKAAKKAAAAAKASQPQTSSTPNAGKAPTLPPAQPKSAQPVSTAPAKASRPPRERHPKPAGPSPVPSGSSVPPGAPSTDIASPTQVEAAASAQPASSRRTRPMLGLASRHFEAALSEAGVERKPRKEKERQAQASPGVAAVSGTIIGDGAARGKAGEDRRSGVRGSSAPRGQGAPTPSAPMILQRDTQPAQLKVPGREGEGLGSLGGDVDEVAAGVRAGVRGRGRGRGRGIARGGG